MTITESKEQSFCYQKTNKNVGLTKIKEKAISLKASNYCK